MRIKKSFILTLLFTSLLFGCDKSQMFSEFPEGLTGGVYELNIEGEKMHQYNGQEEFTVNMQTGLSLDDFRVIIVTEKGHNDFVLEFQLEPEAVEKTAAISSRNVGKQLVFVFNDLVFMAPTVVSPMEYVRIVLHFGDPIMAEMLKGILSGDKDVPTINPAQTQEELEQILNSNL